VRRTAITLTMICLGLALIAHATSTDAMARSHDSRARLHASQEMQSLADGERMPRAKIRVRARKRGTDMAVALRRLEADAEHWLYCDALGDEPIAFMTNQRGRARLRRLPADAGERGEMFTVEVHDADGFVVLEGVLEHPGHHNAHGGGHMASDSHRSPAGGDSEHHADVLECDDETHEHLSTHSHADDELHDHASHGDACDVDHEQGTGEPVHGPDDEDVHHGGGHSDDDARGGEMGHGPHHR